MPLKRATFSVFAFHIFKRRVLFKKHNGQLRHTYLDPFVIVLKINCATQRLRGAQTIHQMNKGTFFEHIYNATLMTWLLIENLI